MRMSLNRLVINIINNVSSGFGWTWNYGDTSVPPYEAAVPTGTWIPGCPRKDIHNTVVSPYSRGHFCARVHFYWTNILKHGPRRKSVEAGLKRSPAPALSFSPHFRVPCAFPKVSSRVLSALALLRVARALEHLERVGF